MRKSVDLSRLSDEDRDAVYDALGLGEVKRQVVIQIAESARKAEAWARAEVGADA